jgi:hypothetical protein
MHGRAVPPSAIVSKGKLASADKKLQAAALAEVPHSSNLREGQALMHATRGTRGHFLSAATAFVAGAPLAVSAQTPAHLVIGTTPIDAAMGIFAAQRAGIFRK